MPADKYLHLGAFIRGPGHHLAAWRHPSVGPVGLDFEHYRRAAAIAERGLFDTVFLADSLAVRNSSQTAETFGRTGHVVHFEPLTLLSALAVTTQRIGLVATASTTYWQPFHLARQFASLDHLSGGRAGWNVVTSADPREAANFGLTSHPDHADRYERAREFVAAVVALWDSWDDDAFLYDKAGGRVFDPAKVHRPAYTGRHITVQGPLNVARPVQGHPVVVQAGSSDAGQDLAAATAEVVFTAHQGFTQAKAFYQSLKARLPRHGRHPDSLKIMPGIFPVVAATRSEAQEKFQILQDLIDPRVGVALVSDLVGGLDLSGLPLDAPLPELGDSNAAKSRLKLVSDLAQADKLTIREVYQALAGARGHRQIVGAPGDIADELEHWFRDGAADGFNIMAPILPDGLSNFVDLVVPELQRRGLFRTAYTGTTLRDHLGLARPDSVHAVGPAAAEA